MRYLSVCSGIEAATVAWEPLGWTPVAFAEIDPFCNAVLAHHYPEVPNRGDFTGIGADMAPIDVLVGGTPCQSFSVAGLRGGMADERGNLALEFIRLADRVKPRWILWENVPGVLSSNKGRDFGAFLGGLAECGYGFAYAVLDAQWFGVPQRRRRVFVVGCLGDWRAAAAVLSFPESLSGHSPPRREAGESVARCLTEGASTGGYRLDPTEETLIPALAHTITANYGKQVDSSDRNGGPPNVVAFAPYHDEHDGRGVAYRESGVNPSLRGPNGTDNTLIAFSCKDSGGDAGELSPTLRAMEYDQSHINGGGQVAIAFDWQAAGAGNDESFRGGSRRYIVRKGDYSGALSANHVDAVAYGISADPTTKFGVDVATTVKPSATGGNQQAVAFTERTRKDGRNLETSKELAFALTNPGGGGRAHSRSLLTGLVVRRLTPRECERLQGFPDDWTLVPYRGKPATDSPRYRAIGNSFAVPVIRWLGKRIAAIDALKE